MREVLQVASFLHSHIVGRLFRFSQSGLRLCQKFGCKLFRISSGLGFVDLSILFKLILDDKQIEKVTKLI